MSAERSNKEAREPRSGMEGEGNDEQGSEGPNWGRNTNPKFLFHEGWREGEREREREEGRAGCLGGSKEDEKVPFLVGRKKYSSDITLELCFDANENLAAVHGFVL